MSENLGASAHAEGQRTARANKGIIDFFKLHAGVPEDVEMELVGEENLGDGRSAIHFRTKGAPPEQTGNGVLDLSTEMKDLGGCACGNSPRRPTHDGYCMSGPYFAISAMIAGLKMALKMDPSLRVNNRISYAVALDNIADANLTCDHFEKHICAVCWADMPAALRKRNEEALVFLDRCDEEEKKKQ